MTGITIIASMDPWVENLLNNTFAKMTIYPDPIKLKKYPILSQILTPFCPRIKGSIQFPTKFGPGFVFLEAKQV